jgi:HEAT repeat protein
MKGRQMDTVAILHALQSDDDETVLDALAEIHSEIDELPEREVAQACERLTSHDDPDVRSAALGAMGLHWAHPDFFHAVLHSAQSERDPDVRIVAVRSLTRYGEVNPKEVRRTLANLVGSGDENLQGVAYIGLLDVAGRLTPCEKATLPQYIGSLDVDWRFVLACRAER